MPSSRLKPLTSSRLEKSSTLTFSLSTPGSSISMMNSVRVSYTSTAGIVTSPGAGSRGAAVRFASAVARTRVSALTGRETGLMRRTMAAGAGLLFLHEVFELPTEFGDGAELAVDRGEPHVGDLVKLLEPVHDELSDLGDADLIV